MPEKTVEFREDEGGFGVLALRPLRIHHSHLQMGKRHQVGCALCSGSVEGVVEEQYFTPKADAVVSGPGADEERDPAYPSGAGWSTKLAED